MINSQYEKSLDTVQVLSKSLQTALNTCHAGLMYWSITPDHKSQMDAQFSPEVDSSLSANMGALFGLRESPRDLSALLRHIVESDRQALPECIANALKMRTPESDCEFRIKRTDNEELRWIKVRVLIELDERTGPRNLVAVATDVTDHKLAEENLPGADENVERAKSLLLTALSSAKIGVFRYTLAGEDRNAIEKFDAWEYNCAEIFGFPAGTKMTADKQTSRMSPGDLEIAYKKGVEAWTTGECAYQQEFPIKLDDGATRWILSKSNFELDEQRRPTMLTGAVIDITDRKLAEDKTTYMATHDGLTGLPNRGLLESLLDHTIESARRYPSKFAVLFIDLDRFKAINDALGHQAGDLLLIEFANRLRRCLRASDILSRISGDEFVVIATELEDEEGAAVIARKILAAAAEPMTLANQKCQVSASVGICLYPEHGEDEEQLMKHADAAMYLAKEAGKNNYQFYNAESTSQSLERMAIESELRSAMANDELSLHYQAKVDLISNKITGVEALLRWNSPKFGSVTPNVFIPIAEESGLIVPIGRWVLQEACKQNVAWQTQGLPPICVAVNLSARQFVSKELLSYIKEALDDSGMRPELLELEITESMVMHRFDKALETLGDIKKLGIRIAIDDFGTGYSSLAQLKRFPIDTLKVDRSFIREVANDSDDQAITEAIIAMGKSLSLTIIAEGVETQEQQDFLRNHRCDEMQGYFFSKPVSPTDFSVLFSKHSGL